MKVLEALRRPDWLKELQAVLIGGLVIVGAVVAFGVAMVVGADSLPVEVPASAVTGTADYSLREGATITPEQDVEVTVTDPSPGQRIAWTLTTLPSLVVVAALLVLLLRVVWYARRSDPFTLATVRRLRVLAVVALAGGWLAFIVEAIAAMELSRTVLTGGLVAYSTVPLYWFLVGFGLFAVAEVVKRGCVMRAELDTVV